MKKNITKEDSSIQECSEITSRNVQSLVQLHQEDSKNRTVGERISDLVSAFCSTISFLLMHIVFIVIWILFSNSWNDPYPFALLTLVLSIEAILLSTFILISQNRQQQMAERLHALDLQINLLAEQENTKMLHMMRIIVDHLGIQFDDDEAQEMLKPTNPKQVIQEIDSALDKSSMVS